MQRAITAFLSALHTHDLALWQSSTGLHFTSDNPRHMVTGPKVVLIDIDVFKIGIFVEYHERNVFVAHLVFSPPCRSGRAW